VCSSKLRIVRISGNYSTRPQTGDTAPSTISPGRNIKSFMLAYIVPCTADVQFHESIGRDHSDLPSKKQQATGGQ
jgi:hypothetical protein